jgi:hypothetical protein
MPRVKVRKTWKIKPIQKPHTTKRGKKGYNRKVEKKGIKESVKEAILNNIPKILPC